MAEIQPATDFMASAIERSGIAVDDGVVFELRLTLTEAFANIVDHAYRNAPDKTADVRVDLDADELALIFTDRGTRPPPSALKSRNLEDYQERGLGLFLISRCMDRFEYFFRADGSNLLKLTRRLVGRVEPPDDDERLPFHVAVYELDGGRVILPIGQFDSTRPNPFESEFIADSRRVVVDLSYLHSLDVHAARSIGTYCSSARAIGTDVSVACPSEEIRRSIAEAGVVVPSGYASAPDIAAGPPESRTPERSTRAKPVVPFAGGRAFAAYMRRLMPVAAIGRNVELAASMNWSARSNGLFFRLIEPFDAAARSRTSWLVIGQQEESGWPAIFASVDFFASLGSLAEGGCTKSVEYGIRSLFSEFAVEVAERHAGASPPVRCQLVALEIGSDSATAWSGAGTPIASVGALPLGAIKVDSSEKLVARSQNVLPSAAPEGGPRRYRVVLGAVSADERHRLLEIDDLAGFVWPPELAARDCGVIDVTVRAGGAAS